LCLSDGSSLTVKEDLKVFYRSIFAAAVACSCLNVPPVLAAALDEVIVSATVLREQELIDVPASVTVLSAQTLRDAGQQHFQDVLAQAPNLNWAAGSSRPRYFQIRGIGEREQYEGAPNSSVGFLIDDIDFSGIGMAATLFDIEQIEVLRGPQGTRYGANALAGLIAVRSAEPSNEFGGFVTGEAGNYGTLGAGIALTGPAEQWNSAWRFAVQKQRSDGFRDNVFLERDDTNDRDETTARGKWRWFVSERSQLDLTFLHSNIDNGYDAFSIDNSRNTLSNAPGEDSQRVNASAIKWLSTFDSGVTVTAVGTLLNSSIAYSFDEDWGNPQSWAPYDYEYRRRSDREHDTQSLELRVASAPVGDAGVAWLAGAYALRLRENILEVTNYSDPLVSRYDAVNSAGFAQLDGRFAGRWQWSAGLRGEYRDADYSDTRPTDADRSDRMLGGQTSLTYELTDKSRVYGAVSRGYKAGGFNLGQAQQRRAEFEPEFLWNYELGYKTGSIDGRLHLETSLFYMRRKNMQVRSGEQADPLNPGTYIFVTSNLADGYNLGLEANVRWLAHRYLELGAGLSWLRTEASGIIGRTGESVPKRDQAHAPRYQAQVNATYRLPIGLMARIDASHVDAFYFDVPTDHDQRSEPYSLVNLKLGYEADRWQIYAWSHNVLNEEYATRGFYFNNEPWTAEKKLYLQNGDPRQFGLTTEWHF
jgi:iron complex outermembrane receptor protein